LDAVCDNHTGGGKDSVGVSELGRVLIGAPDDFEAFGSKSKKSLIDAGHLKASISMSLRGPLTKAFPLTPRDSDVPGAGVPKQVVWTINLKHREETMKVVVAFVGLAISFAVPAVAQEQNTVDPEIRHQIEAVDTKLGEAQNKHDATAVADLFTLDAIRVLDWTGGGTINGREAIEKDFAVHFASNPPDVSGKLVQVYAVGDEMSAISEWSAGPWEGYSLKVYVRDADTWKIRME
jgi:ketosteroid isomerase-like protein